MSVEKIREVIRRHTGPQASDTKKLTHGEVEQMLLVAKEMQRVPAAERLELLAALRMFGGSSIHPSIFESEADKAALVAAVLDGIDSSDRFMTLLQQEQAKLLAELVLGAEPIGIRSVHLKREALPPPLRSRLDELLQANRSRAGAGYDDCPSPGILAAVRGEDTYGYRIECAFLRKDGQVAFSTTDLLNAKGELVGSHIRHEPPDRD